MTATAMSERTREQLVEQYHIERELADRLRREDRREERQRLYSIVYDEFFRRVPHHPQLTRKADPVEQAAAIARASRLLDRFLRPDVTFMEIGAGDCSLSAAVARRVRQVYAVEASAEITRASNLPHNLEVIIASARIPVIAGSVDVAYSHQLIEHLHPSDAQEHFKSVCDALKPGGMYVCVTPNRLNGPHDISKYFDRIATGFHMKEYTISELLDLFVQAGFSSSRPMIGVKGHFAFVPGMAVRVLETVLDALPDRLRLRTGRTRLGQAMLGIIVVAVK